MAYWESDAFNVYSYLRDATPEVEKALVDNLKVREQGYYFNARYRAGAWDGFVNFFDEEKKRILTGMIPFVKQMGYDFPEVVTATNPLDELSLVELNGLELNSYQIESILEVVNGTRRGIFNHLTASGKTAVIAAICSLLRNLNVLVIVPSIELLIQTREALETFLGEETGQLGSGKKDYEKRVVVMYSGFVKRAVSHPFVKNLAKRTHVLIRDELQLATNLEFPFFKRCVNAYYRYGFSGSFFDIDPSRIFSVAGHFGGTITTVTDEDTKREKRTVTPKFTFFEYPIKDEKGTNYPAMYRGCIVANNSFNDYFAKLLSKPYEEGKTILVLVRYIEHSKRFQQALGHLGVECELYNGRINTEERRKLRNQFKNGLLPILIATEQTMGVGVDIPRIELLLNLGCGLSVGATKQKYGRSLRTFEDKDSVDIYEPYITINKIFKRHSNSRLNTAKRYSTGKVKMVFLNGSAQEL